MAMIQIVEDDAFIHELAEMTIRDWGYDTLSADDADEALLLLRSPQVFLCYFQVIDEFLPISILKQCFLVGANLPTRQSSFGRVCVCSTRQEITLPKKIIALFVEGTHCLRKPYTPHQLQHSLEELLAAQS
jgi:CheY-like chemotaxis protein